MHEYTGYTETTSSGWTAGLLLAALALAVLWLGVSPADPDSYDRAETGPMYRVVFIDGTVLHAFAGELHGTGAERLR